jgi:glycosyltransferase involved in cell wall biosynthesis
VILLDVVVPAYRCAPYLREALDSALAQEGAEVRVTVVDDASDDDVAGVVAELDDARVRYVRRDVQGGISAARNDGLRLADRPWLAFLDGDGGRRSHPRLHGRPHSPRHRVGLVHVRATPVAHRPQGPAPPWPAASRARTTALRSGEFIDWMSRARTAGLIDVHVDAIVLHRRVHEASTTATRRDLRADYLDAVRAHLARRPSTGGAEDSA